METTRCALVLLVCACLWRPSRTSSIRLCTDSPTSFVNGTVIPAMLGKPVSVVFCVQCQPPLYFSPFIKIKLPTQTEYPDYYYPNNKRELISVIVNITRSANKATINITIKTVQKEDFRDQFSVKINTNTGINDYSVFLFKLNDAAISDTTTSDAALTLSTQSMMPAVRSISTTPAPSSTELSTVSSQASTAPTSTVTPETAQCRPHKTSQCPENWYQVDNETCLLVTQVSNKSFPGTVCNKHDSEPVKEQDITKLNSCLLKILAESKAASHNYVVRINKQFYVNIQTGIQATDKGPYIVVCTKRTSDFSATTKPIDHAVTTPSGSNKSPTISLFTLSVDYRSPRSLVDNITNYFIVNGTSVYIILACEAEGVPKPRVIITDESGNQVTSGQWFTLAVCSRAEVYTCTTSNFLGTSQAHRRIRMLSTPSVKFTASNKNRRAVIRSGDIVDLTCSVVGCPDRVTIIKNASPIAETANYTIPFVQNIKEVTCSHMGAYTCLAKYPIGKYVQETAYLEVKGCPVSLCEGEAASRELSHIIGANVKFTLCLMSSEGIPYSVSDSKILVKVTRNYTTPRFFWTAIITMYNIQVEDYRTHTVRIANSDGSLDVHFTLIDEVGPTIIIVEANNISGQIILEKKISVIISCQAEGNPPPSLSLRKDETLLKKFNVSTHKSNRTLTYYKGMAECMDTGAYTCHAETGRAATNKTVAVYVKCAQQFTDPDNLSRSYKGQMNRTVSISVPVFGYPEPTVTLNSATYTISSESYKLNYIKQDPPYGTVSLMINIKNASYFQNYNLNIRNAEGLLTYSFEIVDGADSEKSDSPPSAVGAIFGGIVSAVLVIFIIVVVICLLGRKGAVSQGKQQQYVNVAMHTDCRSNESEDTPEAHVPGSPHYEEIIDFRPDMPDKSNCADQRVSTKRDEVVEYEIPVCGFHDT